MTSDPTIDDTDDTDRTGADLLARIAELTAGENAYRRTGGNGWGPLLVACEREINRLRDAAPADGDESPDDAFLRTLGFAASADPDEPGWMLLTNDAGEVLLSVQSDSPLPWTVYLGETEDWNVWPWDIHTRQQLRDIVRAVVGRVPA